ncbi:nuclear transport factor 2 family protein [Thermodesulfobacteriota bacterium]
MTVRKLLALSISVFLVMGASALSASEKVQLRAQDRVEIEQLMWEYIEALDSHDAEAFVNKFTPDGQFLSRESTAKGRDALKKMVVDAWKKMDADNEGDKKKSHMYHIVTNPHIEFIDEDHARYYAYWMGVLETGGEIVTAGREANELVRINGRWLIKVRDVNPGK